MSKRYKNLVLVCLLVLCVLSSARLFDDVDYWFMDIASNFQVQYAFFALILFLICIWKKIFPLAVLTGLLFVLNADVLVDSGGSVQAAVQAKTTFNVYSANIYKSNSDLSKLNYILQESDPEIVLLLEVNPQHIEQLRKAIQRYPYSIVNTSFAANGIGIVFLSKFPILNHQLTKLSEHGNAIIEAAIEINNKPVMFYGVHAQRPDVENFDERKEQFIMLARQISKQTLPVIAAGDLNSTPSTPNFRKLLKISGLRDSRTGFGWEPSWPTYFPFFWIPIDHILVSPEVHVHNRVTGSPIGSDHYPVFAELSIN
ncbi:MAG: endonuclease/exonuclease/phosphatase family protein [Nitrospirae bacterium]|nr:endonuclease/exonuclease/phosphatase family protein [Nitrospirota bacterium]